jgi:two-component system cell cycle sensor histidine kinase/response regulator CckA
MTLQPRTFANEAFANAASPNGVSVSACPCQRTILVVEDEPFVREATCGILESAGFEVLPAKDAREAMKIYQDFERRIDLVMTDMVLPGRSGEQLGQDLRKLSPEVVVLVTSGYSNPEYEAEAPESHTYFLAKPYSKRTLIDKIETILGALPLAQATQAG